MSKDQDAVFVPAIQCPACLDVNHVGYTATHPRGNGDWCCLRCGYTYPNSDWLKHYARPTMELFVAQTPKATRPDLLEEPEPETTEVQPT